MAPDVWIDGEMTVTKKMQTNKQESEQFNVVVNSAVPCRAEQISIIPKKHGTRQRNEK